MSDPDADALLAGIGALERACDDDDWELAYTLMHGHDCRLREALARRPASGLEGVLRAQHDLVGRMRERQRIIAQQVAALRQGNHAVACYRESAGHECP